MTLTTGDCLEEMARMPDESVGSRGAVPPSQQAIRRLSVDPQFLPQMTLGAG